MPFRNTNPVPPSTGFKGLNVNAKPYIPVDAIRLTITPPPKELKNQPGPLVRKTDETVKPELKIEISAIKRCGMPHEFRSAQHTLIKDSAKHDYIDKFRQILETYPDGLEIPDFHNEYIRRYKKSFDPTKFGFNSLETAILSWSDIFYLKKDRNSKWILFDARISSKSRKESWIPSLVLDNIDHILKDYPDGLDGHELIQNYSKKFMSELNLKLLGFDTVGDFLRNCPNVKVVFDGEQCTVFPKIWDKKQTEPTVRPIPENSLQITDIWSTYMDVDVCGPDVEYKKIEFANFKFAKVVICEIGHQGKFWIHLDAKKQDLIRLMFNLNEFYNVHEKNYVINEFFIKENLICAVQWHDKWHRARIINKNNDKEVEVSFVDYGKVYWIPLSKIRALRTTYLKDPMYAISSSLHDIVPVNPKIGFTKEFTDILLQYYDKYLCSIVHGIHLTEPYLELVLIDTSQNEDVIINELLVNSGHAMHQPLANSIRINPVVEDKTKYVSNFYEMLPSWLYKSSNSHMDLETAVQALEVCNSKNATIAPPDTCCKIHFLRSIFNQYPELMIKSWKNLLSPYEAQLEIEAVNYFIKFSNIDELKSKLLPRTCRENISYNIPSYRKEEEPASEQQEAVEIPPNVKKDEPVQAQAAPKIHGKKSIIGLEQDRKNIFNNAENCRPRGKIKKSNFVRNHDPAGINDKNNIKINQPIKNNSKIEENKENTIIETDKIGLEPKEHKKNTIIEISISENVKLRLVRYRNLICLICQELIKLYTDEPYDQVQQRLQTSDAEWIYKITPQNDPVLYLRLSGFVQKSEYHLVGLKWASRFVKMVVPDSDAVELKFNQMWLKVQLELVKDIIASVP